MAPGRPLRGSYLPFFATRSVTPTRALAARTSPAGSVWLRTTSFARLPALRGRRTVPRRQFARRSFVRAAATVSFASLGTTHAWATLTGALAAVVEPVELAAVTAQLSERPRSSR